MVFIQSHRAARRLRTVACILIAAAFAWIASISLTVQLAAADDAPATPPTVEELHHALVRQADWWFPRVIDREHGGFHQAFDDQHQPATALAAAEEARLRTTVYQSRIIWVAATLARVMPDRAPQLRPYVDHGLAYLRQHLTDPEHGGLFYARTVDGQLTAQWGDRKHVYGVSFALYAAAAAARAFPDSDGLALAREQFDWLETHAHDAEHGGYLEALTADNRPLLEPIDRPDLPPIRFDAIGTLFGYKSMNSHIHLLEAFTELHHVWPDPLLRQRLAEVDELVRQRMFVEPGCLHMFFTRDWRPVPNPTSFGHGVETAFLLIESGRTLQRPDEQVLAQPRQLIDHALIYGWDGEFGGLTDEGSAFRGARHGSKVWWVQAEMLNALAHAHALWPDEPLYAQRLAEQWRFIREHLIDPADGGWYSTVSRDGQRLVNPRKAHHWNAGYHTVRGLAYAIDALNDWGQQPREAAAQATAAQATRDAPQPWTRMPDPAGEVNFRFAVVSDNSGGERPGIFPDAMHKLHLLRPDFIMSVGDFIEGYGANEGELNRQWDRIDDAVARLGDVPFFFVPGNHDIAHPLMKRVWHERFGPDYYHFVYGNVLMLCLNAQQIFPEGIEADQIAYVEQVLADHPDVQWTFVFLHKPLWRTRGAGWAQIEQRLASRPHTVFAGHIHNYRLENRGGNDHFVLAVTGGANTLRGVEHGDFDHVMWVTMTDDGPRFANILLDGVYDKHLTRTDLSPLHRALRDPQTVAIEPLYVRADGRHAEQVRLAVTNPTDEPLHLSIAVDPPPGIAVDRETVTEVIDAADRRELDIALRVADSRQVDWPRSLRLRYEMRFEGVDPSGLPVREPVTTAHLVPQPLRPIPPADAPIHVDGRVDDWPDLPWTSPEHDHVAASFAFGLRHDDDHLYVGIRVLDEQLVGKGNDRPWSQDGLELRIDTRPDPQRSNHDGRGDAGFANHLLIGLALGADADHPGRLFAADRLPEGITARLQRTAVGYDAEVAIPHPVLDRYHGGPWRKLRLNLTVNDLNDPQARPAQLWWQPDWRTSDNIIGSGTFTRTPSGQ